MFESPDKWRDDPPLDRRRIGEASVARGEEHHTLTRAERGTVIHMLESSKKMREVVFSRKTDRSVVRTGSVLAPVVLLARDSVLADKDPITVLLVDDDPAVARTIRRMLAGHRNIRLEHCRHAIEAVATAGAVRPTVILQDLGMPEIHGLTLLKQYCADPSIRDVPVIALSTKEARQLKNKAFSLGASDYLIKLPDQIELVARIRVHSLTRLNQLKKDEANRALHESQLALIASHDALAERIGELQAARDELARLVSTDTLTELYSRYRWFELSALEFIRYQRHHHPLGVIIVDLDLFKSINDTFGHEAGDGVLKQFASALKLALRQTDIAGRIGGEEFAVLLPETSTEGVQMVARRIVEKCRDLEVATPLGNVKFSCSVGVAEATPDDQNVEDALRRADRALYNAKERGRDCWAVVRETPAPPLVEAIV